METTNQGSNCNGVISLGLMAGAESINIVLKRIEIRIIFLKDEGNFQIQRMKYIECGNDLQNKCMGSN